jgi:hypothetical protein
VKPSGLIHINPEDGDSMFLQDSGICWAEDGDSVSPERWYLSMSPHGTKAQNNSINNLYYV